MSKGVAYTFTDGVIQFSNRCPRGALPIAMCTDGARLREAVSAVARHGHEPGVLLVPGVPEADTEKDGMDALLKFRHRVYEHLLQPA
ncbi:MAG: host nuclease inhibitor protein [Pseudomonadota bacterium]